MMWGEFFAAFVVGARVTLQAFAVVFVVAVAVALIVTLSGCMS